MNKMFVIILVVIIFVLFNILLITVLVSHNRYMKKDMKKVDEKLPKIKGWIARDKTYDLHFFSEKPQRHIAEGMLNWDNVWIGKKLLDLDCDLYPELNWENEPIEAELIINKKI